VLGWPCWITRCTALAPAMEGIKGSALASRRVCPQQAEEEREREGGVQRSVQAFLEQAFLIHRYNNRYKERRFLGKPVGGSIVRSPGPCLISDYYHIWTHVL